MKNTRAKVLMAAAALCGSLGLGLLVHTAPASAAPVTIGGCTADTGSTDTATITVTLDDSALATGVVIPLHDRVGKVNGFYNGITYDPLALDNAMSSPVCGVQKVAGGALKYGWLYCTEKPLNVCGNAPWLQNNGASSPTLTTLDKARLAWLLDNELALGTPQEASNRTQASRAQRQRLVWCVSEHLAANAPAPAYLAPFEGALTCPDWTTIDPTLNLNPQVAVTAAPAAATVGAPVTFTVNTNISPLKIDTVGLDTVALCAPQAGVTYAGGMLTVAGALAGKQVPLCATKAAPGTGSLTATIANLSVSTLQFWQRAARTDACQGMLSTELSIQPGATAQAQASWQAIEDTTVVNTTTTTTPPVGSTTTDPTTTTTRPPEVLDTTIPNTLPRTGAGEASGTARYGVLFLLLGVTLVLLGRRRRPTGA